MDGVWKVNHLPASVEAEAMLTVTESTLRSEALCAVSLLFQNKNSAQLI